MLFICDLFDLGKDQQLHYGYTKRVTRKIAVKLRKIESVLKPRPSGRRNAKRSILCLKRQTQYLTREKLL